MTLRTSARLPITRRFVSTTVVVGCLAALVPGEAARAQAAVVSVAPRSASVPVGDSLRLVATVSDSAGGVLIGQPIVWSSANTAVATVSATGTVTGKSQGLAGITARVGRAVATATVVVTPERVVDFVVAPSTLALGVGESRGLALEGPGAAAGRRVFWTTSDPSVATVISSGLVTANGPGRATITATAAGQSASATVTVTGTASAATRVAAGTPAPRSVEPGSAASPSGGRAGRGRGEGGARPGRGAEHAGERQRPPSSEGGRAGSGGPPAEHGPPPTPPRPATPGSEGDGRGLWPHEPPGFRKIAERDFSSKARTPNDTEGAQGFAGIEADAPLLRVVEDPSSPRSRGSVLEMRYPAGKTGGSSVGFFTKDFGGGYREVYVSVWVKLSANWQGHSSGTNKMFFLWFNRGPRFFISAEGRESGPLAAQIRLQSTPDRRTHFNSNLVPGAQVVRGVWQRWELLVRTNTPGVADGEMHWWIDGVKTHEYRNVMFGGPEADNAFVKLQAAAVWGGTGNMVRQDMTLSWDHIYISGKQE